jgi:hypothetical protein
MKNTFEYKLRDFTFSTIGDLAIGEGSVLIGVPVIDILLFEKDRVQNIDRILALAEYTESELNQVVLTVNKLRLINPKPKTDLDIPKELRDDLYAIKIAVGTTLYLPSNKIDSNLARVDRITPQEISSFPYFMANKLKELHQDITFERISEFANKNLGNLKQIYPDITVWVWSRTLSAKLFSDEVDYNDRIINITPFVFELTTNVSSQGGVFSFNLPYITGDLVGSEWQFRENSVKRTSTHYTAKSSPLYTGKNGLMKNRSYFEKVLQPNDIVFIRFETLEKEKALIQQNKNVFYIDKSTLPKGIFDMIGLIDDVNQSQDANLNDQISVNGRDCIKLLIEDGVYFYPFDFIQGGMFANEKNADRLQRFDGKLMGRFQTGFKTVENALGFIFNSLGEIKISSDTLFEDYGDDREFKRRLSSEVLDDRREKNKDLDNLRKELRELIFQARKQDGLLPKEAKDDPKLTIVFQELFNFIKALYDANKLKEVNSKISGWEKYNYLGEEYIQDAFPPTLHEDTANPFYVRKLAKLPNKSNVTLAQKQKAEKDLKGLVLRREDTLEEFRKYVNRVGAGRVDALDKKKAGESDNEFYDRINKSFEVVNNLFDINGIPKEAGSDVTFAPVQDLKNRVQNQIINFPDGTIGRVDLKSSSEKAAESQMQVDEINKEIQRNLDIIDRFNKGEVYIRIDKKLKELTQVQRQAIDKMLEFVKLQKKEIENTYEIIPQKGIWSIIRLVVDDSVRQRRIVSADLGNEMGSMINAIKKICLEPFTEFFGDTYGNSFHFVVRKPPFDKQGVQSYLGKNISSESKQIVNSNTQDSKVKKEPFVPTRDMLIVDIQESDIISENIKYGGQAYSWYKLTPQTSIGGFDDSVSLAYLKAVYFPEYAEIWGSKPMDVSTNYIPYFPKEGTALGNRTNIMIEQGILDLKYMIECNQYLPFVTSGTLSINPDRRIKRGTFVRRVGTGEIFYVDAVAQNYSISESSIDRVTDLTLSRGMVEKYITHPKYNYFNIINTDLDTSVFRERGVSVEQINQRTISNWKVNKDVFSFFLKKLQYNIESESPIDSLIQSISKPSEDYLIG